MPKTQLLVSLLLVAAASVSAPGCKLDRPTEELAGGAGGAGAICGSGGTSGSIDAGSIDGGGIITVTPAPLCNAANVSLRLPYVQPFVPKPEDLATVQKLLVQMSLEDRADQMRGRPWGSAGLQQMTDVERSDDTETVRGYRYRDASRGMNLAEDLDGAKPNAGTWYGTKVGYSTVFPASIARGASFDLDLEFAVGEAIGDEMMAAKQTLLLAPCMNLVRHPSWGRTQENYGEDSYHLGRLASAMVIGVQQHITANAKHYMLYDIEKGRDFNDMSADEQTLREIYGRHFRMVVQDGGVGSVMASYNMVNGTKSVENTHTLTTVLRDDFGFNGFVLSDWWAMNPQLKVNTDATTLKGYALRAVQAGLDVELPWKLNYAFLENLVKTGGGISEADIDRGAGRVLLQKVRFNSVDPQQGTWGLGQPKTTYKKGRIIYSGCDGHIDLARKAAVKSMVLLKNAGNTLPISPAITKVAVVGATVPYTTTNDGRVTQSLMNFAKDVHTGDMGSSRVFGDPALSVGPYDGIKKMAPEGITVETTAAPIDTVDVAQKIGSDPAVSSADFVVVIAGLTPGDEGEEYTLAEDRPKGFGLDIKQTDPRYIGIQNKLIEAVIATGKPMVVVLQGGSVIDMPWLDRAPAVVMAWYGGMVVGDAMGQLLWGQENFGGKLPLTWGRFTDYPEFKAATGATRADYYQGYRYFDKFGITPVFPFGHGLSYTTFAYSDLQLGCQTMAEGGVLPVYVNVTNTGVVPGDEVVLLFASFPNSTAARRITIKELKGFARVSLSPGETKQVAIPVRLKDLDYYDEALGAWVVEDGPVTFMVGGSSTDSPLTATVNVVGYTKLSSNY
jgi:beta-glucosidase